MVDTLDSYASSDELRDRQSIDERPFLATLRPSLEWQAAIVAWLRRHRSRWRAELPDDGLQASDGKLTRPYDPSRRFLPTCVDSNTDRSR